MFWKGTFPNQTLHLDKKKMSLYFSSLPSWSHNSHSLFHNRQSSYVPRILNKTHHYIQQFAGWCICACTMFHFVRQKQITLGLDQMIKAISELCICTARCQQHQCVMQQRQCRQPHTTEWPMAPEEYPLWPTWSSSWHYHMYYTWTFTVKAVNIC